MLVAGGTAQNIIDRLHREIVAVLAHAEMRERCFALGFGPAGSTPANSPAASRGKSRNGQGDPHRGIKAQ
jgi:hypothetical protein